MYKDGIEGVKVRPPLPTTLLEDPLPPMRLTASLKAGLRGCYYVCLATGRILACEATVDAERGKMADFVKAATTNDLAPGQAAVVDVNGRPIALFNVNGEFIALDNVCAHRGGPLAEGFVDPINMSVQCPWHGWSFGLIDGKCHIGPGGVEKFEVKLEGTDVMIAV